MSRSSCVRFRHFIAWNIHTCFFSHFFFLVFVAIPFVITHCQYFYHLLSLAFFSEVVFESLFWCIHAIFSTDKFSFSYFIETYICFDHFLGCKTLYIVINFLFFLSILRTLTLGTAPVFLSVDIIPAVEIGFEIFFWFFWCTHPFFFSFFNPRLFDGVSFQSFQVLTVFLFYERSTSFLIW